MSIENVLVIGSGPACYTAATYLARGGSTAAIRSGLEDLQERALAGTAKWRKPPATTP